jgi:multidrug efflux pump subunit AcrA (membrane-fusion protein)
VERVFVIVDNTVSSKEVKSGVEEEDWIEVVEGLTEGERVVASALDRLMEGMTVQVAEAP